MVTDAMLCKAADDAEYFLLEELPVQYAEPHVFSEHFEKDMAQLCGATVEEFVSEQDEEIKSESCSI